MLSVVYILSYPSHNLKVVGSNPTPATNNFFVYSIS